MTAEEAKSVIDLWQQERVEQTGLTDHPAVPDVAEGLDIPVEEVQRLLATVRARRVEEEHRLAHEQKLAEAMLLLAEEEARLSEVQQHRADLQWERVVAEQQQGQQEAYSRRSALHTKTPESRAPGRLVAFIIAVTFALFIAAMNASRRAASMPHIYTKVVVGPYGRPMPEISSIPVMCYDGHSEVPCDDATIERERQALEAEKHGETTPRSKANDTKTHR